MAAKSDEPQIRVETTRTGPVRHRLEIEVDAKRVRRAFDGAYRDLARRAQVRGFRRGKVPRSILEKLYGASLAEDMERALVAESLADALEQAELKPVSEPTIDATPPVPDAPFRYTAEIETLPEIELAQVKGLAAKRPRVEVEESEIIQELDTLRHRHSPIVEEPPDTPVARGHIVHVDFTGTVDGEPFEGGSGEDVAVEIGSGRFEDFEDALVGATAGERREVRVTFPESHGDPRLAGKEAVFDTRVRDVRRRELPEIDDEFAKDVGDFDSLGALRERIREELTSMRERQADTVLTQSLLESLRERNPIEVPASMAERALAQRLSQAHRRLEGQVPEQALHAQLDAWREEWRSAAERDVHVSLLLDQVAREQGIEVEDAEVDARIEELAREQGMEAPRLRKAYREANLLGSLRGELRERKALDFLKAEARIQETDPA